MGYQIGIIGIILFILILSILSINAYNYYKNNIELKNKTDYLGLLSLYMPIILLVVFTFQENTFTPQCIVPYMLIQGSFYCGINNKESKFPPMKWLSVCVEKLNKYKPQINIKA